MPRSTITTRFAFEETNATVLQRVNRGVKDFGAFVFSPAGAIAGAAALGGAMAGLTGRYLENADALQKMSLRTGLGTEELGALKFAFEQADLSGDDLQRTLTRLNDRGIGLDEFANQIAGIEDISQQTSRAIEVFGDRLGPRLLSVLNDGSEGLDRYRMEHERLGLGIDDSSAAAAARFNDNIDTINRVVEGAGNRIGEGIINWGGPILEAFGEAVGVLPNEARQELDKLNASITSYVSEAQAAGKTYGEAVADGVSEGLFTKLEAIKAKAALEFDLFSGNAVSPADNPQESLSLLVGPFGTPADTETNRQAANALPAFYRRQGEASPYSDSNIIIDGHGGSPGIPAGAVARVLGQRFDQARADRERVIHPEGGFAFTATLATLDVSLRGITDSAERLAATEALKAETDRSTFELTQQAEAFSGSQSVAGGPDGVGGRGGFGGGGFGDPAVFIEATKNDPVRVAVAGLGGLNDNSKFGQRVNELRIEDELINREALVAVILDIFEDFNT